jgi:hypothetical protein
VRHFRDVKIIILVELAYSYSHSSFGWDPAAKLAELFDPLSRFILVQIEERLAAFAMFRFEYEDYNNLLYWSVLLCFVGIFVLVIRTVMIFKFHAVASVLV